uniref:Uncharacterized protein n=1 Tax=mine drainage metagenome TaxID=410659 RepID=E6PSG3_9ZZZZ
MITTVIIPAIFLRQVGWSEVVEAGKPGKPSRQGPPCGPEPQPPGAVGRPAQPSAGWLQIES